MDRKLFMFNKQPISTKYKFPSSFINTKESVIKQTKNSFKPLNNNIVLKKKSRSCYNNPWL